MAMAWAAVSRAKQKSIFFCAFGRRAEHAGQGACRHLPRLHEGRSRLVEHFVARHQMQQISMAAAKLT